MRKTLFVVLIILIVLFSYYLLNYERVFLHDENKKYYISVWKQNDGKCLIIPNKYYSIFKPRKNYIETQNNSYLYVAWDGSGKEIANIYIGSSYKKNFINNRIIGITDTLDDFFYKYRGEYYDPNNETVFNPDSIKYKKAKYEITYLNIKCSGLLNKIYPCFDW